MSIQKLAAQHWTPVVTARKAARFLANRDHVKILDIGSGVGKFCLVGAHYSPHAMFYGVEQRRHLVNCAELGKLKLGLNNVSFLHQNLTELDFRDYDHFYFFNSFYENLPAIDKIDNSLVYSTELFHFYSKFLYKQLSKMPSGTRLVTLQSLGHEIPPGYHIQWSDPATLLQFWEKK